MTGWEKSEENVLTGGRLFGRAESESIKGSVLESSHMDVEVPLDRFCRNGGYGGLSSLHMAGKGKVDGYEGMPFQGKYASWHGCIRLTFHFPLSGSEISTTDYK